MQSTTVAVETMKRLAKSDAVAAASEIGINEARFLVDQYYMIQHNRITAANQFRSITRSGEPAFFQGWLGESMESVEISIKKILDAYSDMQPVGKWARSICGIGPVIASGLISHIDIEKAPTVGHIWRFAGLDPTSVWNKGEKRPWNASLKRLCWIIGESFVKVQGNENDVYGAVFRARKDLEIERNEAGAYAEQAAAILKKKKFADNITRKIYETGKLPPAHIHARARRYAVKLFLSHLHDFWYREHFGKAPPLPYPISKLGHVHMIERPS